MTPSELDKLQKLVDAATPGPWDALSHTGGGPWHKVRGPPTKRVPECEGGGAEMSRVEDVQFIAAARNAIGPLIARVRELEVMVNGYYKQSLQDSKDLFDCAQHISAANIEREDLEKRIEELEYLADPYHKIRAEKLEQQVAELQAKLSNERDPLLTYVESVSKENDNEV
jgi:hypothetical protein